MKKKFINGKIYGYKDATEILVEDGKFVKFGKDLGEADEVINLDGNLVIPPYVDAHLHLDYYMIGKTDEVKNESGTLFEAIDLWNDFKKDQLRKK